MMVEEPWTKRISFESYDKYFRDALMSPDDNHIVFFYRGSNVFTISFSWDNFVIITKISLEEIRAKYAAEQEGTNSTPYEVATDDTGEEPAVVRFKAEYVPARAIPEEL
jgi:hypothetical protein